MNAPSTVLVVDDTDAHRYVMSSWLRRAGHTVIEAATGSEALALAGPHLDAVVLDVNLPDVPGPEVCSRLKAAPETEQVPVLHVSATSIDARSRTAGLERGADAYLAEPLDEGEFVATVRALCRTREAHRGVGAIARRMERLASALVPLHEARSYEQVVEAAARGAHEVLGRPVIAMVVVEQGLVLRALCSGEDDLILRSQGDRPVGGLAPNQPTVVSLHKIPSPWQELFDQSSVPAQDWYTTLLADADGEAVGGLGIGHDAENPLTAEDVDATTRFTEAMTVALSNLRSFAEEHRVALALQSAMLPQKLPTGEDLDIAARYRASDALLEVGGDFYDAFALDEGRVALVIGDVQGHSLRAATVMGELRISLRAYLREGHEPARAVELLNSLLMDGHPEFVTACVCILDTRTGALEIVNAGHLPPLVVRADGTARYVMGASRILGLSTDEPRRSRTERLTPGDTVVLVTDGLVERRDVSLRHNLEVMATVVAEVAGKSPDDVCDVLLGRFSTGQEDDVAVLAARWPAATEGAVGSAAAAAASRAVNAA